MTENEKRKQEIIIEFYNTGRINKLYFNRTSKSKQNPLKAYIQKYLYKNFLLFDNDLESDCYQELFLHLQKMDADKFMKIYDESPNKLIATALRIVVLQCFAADNRTGNPTHSLTKMLSYTSSFDKNNFQINHIEKPDDDSDTNNNELIIYDEDLDEFESEYGLTVEEFIALLSDEDRAYFEFLLQKKGRGRPKKKFTEERDNFYQKLRDIKNDINKGDKKNKK